MSNQDFSDLARDLDRTKSSVFLGKNSAFFGSLMCSLDFQWTHDMPTAATDGTKIYWNPDFFRKLSPGARTTVLKHELWHVARIHMIRKGDRDHKLWNWACDIRINNDLIKDGECFDGIENCFKDPALDKAKLLSEEEIYDILANNQMPPPPSGSFGGGEGDMDMAPTSAQDMQAVVNRVVQAVQQAKLSGQAGALPGGIEETISAYLDPVVPWQQVLMQFFTEMLDEDYTWARPNRRFQDMYLPSRFQDEGRLTDLVYFLDVSGSCSSADILRFNSEVKYVQEVLDPQKLTLVQFDTKIQKTDQFETGQPFTDIEVKGRGGTSLVCVARYIEKHKPTAAIIFTDLECAPMPDLTHNCPIIWAVLRNKRASVPFGKIIHID